MSYNSWEVWAADVRYEDSPTIKSRPVLVLYDKAIYVVCLKMTGTAPRDGEYALIDWSAVGLKKPTTVRIRKVLKMTSRDLKYKIGELSARDILNIQALLFPPKK